MLLQELAWMLLLYSLQAKAPERLHAAVLTIVNLHEPITSLSRTSLIGYSSFR